MKYFRILMICLILGACSKNERLIYTDMPGVYFPDYTLDADSLVYSFRMKMQHRLTEGKMCRKRCRYS